MQTYLIALVPRAGVSAEDIEKILDSAVDWYRFQRNCWLVKTNNSAQHWVDQLVDYYKPGGQIFMSRVDSSDQQGWMRKAFWDWTRKTPSDAEQKSFI